MTRRPAGGSAKRFVGPSHTLERTPLFSMPRSPAQRMRDFLTGREPFTYKVGRLAS